MYESLGVKKLVELPIDPKLTQLVDKGLIEDYETNLLDGIVDIIHSLELKEKKRWITH